MDPEWTGEEIDVDLRRRGRRSILGGAGAAALTATAVVMAPVAAAAPADDAREAVEAVQQEAEGAVDEAEEALERARQEASEATEGGSDRAEQEAREAVGEAERALEEARQQAEQAIEDAQEQAEDLVGTMPKIDFGDWLPDFLERDLQQLQEAPADERAEELEDIVRSGLDGEYGNEVESWTERLGGLISSLPEDLRQDIRGVMGQDPEEARDDVRQIVERAVDGEYGAEVEEWADWLRDTAQRWDLGSAIQGTDPMEGSGGN